MTMTFWRREWPTLLTLAVTAVLVAWSWSRIPERVGVHWNIHGEIDRYGGRFEALALVPLLLLGCSVLTFLLGRLGPAKNAEVMWVVRLGLALMGLCFTAQYILEWEPARAGLVGVGLLFALLGNIMGKVQPSPLIGFRTRWTYLSKRAWYQSQRRSGVFLFSFGLLSVLLGLSVPKDWLLPWVLPMAFLVGLWGGIGWLIYASYLDYQRDPQPEPVRPATD